jgi:hypothetical protein
MVQGLAIFTGLSATYSDSFRIQIVLVDSVRGSRN